MNSHTNMTKPRNQTKKVNLDRTCSKKAQKSPLHNYPNISATEKTNSGRPKTIWRWTVGKGWWLEVLGEAWGMHWTELEDKRYGLMCQEARTG